MPETRVKILLLLLGFLLASAQASGASSDGKSPKDKGESKSVKTAGAKAEPTPNPDLEPPKVKPRKGYEEEFLPAVRPATLPDVRFPDKVEATPTPMPGSVPRDPTAAALMSAVVPGLGHVYCGEPVRGLFFSAAFGISLYLALDNLRLEPETGSDQRVARNETAGSLYGLAALAAYGFGMQDAAGSARRYNRRNHLNLSVSAAPYPHAVVAYAF